MIFERGFKQTMALATVFSLASVYTGLIGSYVFDTPSGPSIVAVLVAFFILSFGVRSLKRL
jgi:ABC-type Mn2+/Zn2+ transport system permease subunit